MAELISSNATINTSQPEGRPNFRVRGVKPEKTIVTEKDGKRMVVNEEDYDRELHGVKTDKLPVKKKTAKNKSKSSD
jgi:hypothetical protein